MLIVGLASFIIYFIFLYSKSLTRNKLERQQLQQQLLLAEIEVREQALNEVASELHDNVGQLASLLKINLNLLATAVAEPLKPVLDESLDLSKEIIVQIKQLSVDLSNDKLHNLSFYQALEKLIQRIDKAAVLETEWNLPAEPLPYLPREMSLFLYRMSQEALNNVIQHSMATKVSVTVEAGSNYLKVSIKDNGQGFDIEQAESSGSSGLKNLKARCQLIHAKLHIVLSSRHRNYRKL